MQIGAEATEVGHDALHSERLQPCDRLRRVRLVIQQQQLERHLLASHADAAGRVDVLHGNLVARAHLSTASAVAPGHRDDSPDLDGLGRRERRPESERYHRQRGEHSHRDSSGKVHSVEDQKSATLPSAVNQNE